MDNTTLFAIAKATGKTDAHTTVRFILEDILPCYGMSAEIQTDRGTHFVADTLNQLYKALGIVNRTSIAYRPQSQGITERYNSTLLKFQLNKYYNILIVKYYGLAGRHNM